MWGSPRSLRGLTVVLLMNIRLNEGEEASRGALITHQPLLLAIIHYLSLSSPN